MADKKIKKYYGNVGLIAQVSDEFRDVFQAQIKERGQRQKDVLIASIKFSWRAYFHGGPIFMAGLFSWRAYFEL